jgi:hypothetical protein
MKIGDFQVGSWVLGVRSGRVNLLDSRFGQLRFEL